jgi:hypothetical protein
MTVFPWIPELEINIRENRRGNQTMDNPEKLEIFVICTQLT